MIKLLERECKRKNVVLELQNRLGHTDISTTLGTYSHLRPTAMKEVADKLDGVLLIK